MRIARLERRELVGIDPRDRVVRALPGHATNGRSCCSKRQVRASSRAPGTLRRCCSTSKWRPPARSARSRAWPAAAAARPCPGSCSRRVDPGPSTGSRRVSSADRCSSPPRTARRRRRRWSPRSSAAGSPTTAPARTSSRGSPPPSSRRPAPSSACSRSTRRRCPRSRGACGRSVVALGNLFRDQLDRYGELEHVAERWRGASPSCRRRCSSSTPTTRSSASSRAGASGTVTYGLDDPRHARASRCSTRPTRRTASSAGRRTSTRRPTSVISATTAARTATPRGSPLDVAAREIELHGLDGSEFTLDTPAGARACRAARCPGLYNVYNATAAAAIAGALGVSPEAIAERPRALHRRVRPVRADRRSATEGC